MQEREEGFDPAMLEDAYAHSFRNRAEVEASAECGCYFCLEVFAAAEVTEWLTERLPGGGETGFCPRCGIDSLIGDAPGLPLSPGFLRATQRRWFHAAGRLPGPVAPAMLMPGPLPKRSERD